MDWLIGFAACLCLIGGVVVAGGAGTVQAGGHKRLGNLMTCAALALVFAGAVLWSAAQ